MSDRVLIIEAESLLGAVLARGFRQAGWSVDRYQRGSDMTIAARGVRWIIDTSTIDGTKAQEPQVRERIRALIGAAAQTGVSLMFPADISVFGKEPAPWGPHSPNRPVTRRGRLAVEMENRLREAAEAQRSVTLILRHGELLHAPSQQAMLNRVILAEIDRSRIIAPGRPHVPRSYIDAEDLSQIALSLSETADLVPGRLEIGLPGTRFSYEALTHEISRQLGREIGRKAFPWSMMRLLAPFRERARLALEDRYIFNHPHEIDGTGFSGLFPDFHFKPLERIVFEHLYLRGLVVPSGGQSTSTQTSPWRESSVAQ